MSYGKCPRCGGWSVEHLNTHSHCLECNYFPGSDDGLVQWKAIEFRKTKPSSEHDHLARTFSLYANAVMMGTVL